MRLAQLKSEAINSRIMAREYKRIWQDYEREAETLRRQVSRKEIRTGIRGLILIVILFIGVTMLGCQTLKGGLQDVGWTANKLAENINPEENK